MSSSASVTEAIECFDSWATPWGFFSNVSESPALNEADRQLLGQVWAMACDRDAWLSADGIESGITAAEAALSSSFPWLSPLACRQLARAAAYQWR